MAAGACGVMDVAVVPEFSQAEIIALSGKLCSAAEAASRRIHVGPSWCDDEYGRGMDLLAEIRSLRDAVTVMAPRGAVPVAELFA